jgi:hypothetical protein
MTFAPNAQDNSPAGPATLQPFICDQRGLGTGSSQFVSALHHLWLQLSISEKSDVQVGVNFNNVAGLRPAQIMIDYKGDVNDTFGPWLVLSYQLPSGKVAGKVVSFTQGQALSGAAEGFNRIAFTGDGLGLPAGTVLRALEIIAIGENASGTVTLGDVTTNGVAAGKLMNAQMTCDFVP